MKELFISKSMTGKMHNVCAISTLCELNPFCIARHKVKECICYFCYAFKHLWKDARRHYADNTEILTSHILTDDEIPVINREICRFESHGDLQNMLQAINYILIAKKNPDCTFALWTKCPVFIRQALAAGYDKPNNLIIIYSNCHVNRYISDADLISKYPFIDKVFSVFTKDFAKANHVNINCGARSCDTCRRCYNKRTGFHVNELLK